MRTRMLVGVAGVMGLLASGCSDSDGEAARATRAAPLEAAPAQQPPAQARADQMVTVYVRLRGPSAAALIRPGADPGAPAVAKRTRARVAELEALHASYRPLIQAHGGTVIAELSRLANALQVRIARSQLVHIARLPDVVGIEGVTRYRRRLQTTLDVVGAPAVWAGTPAYHGEGIRIAVVDSGIDYDHADFGGSGDPADYAANDPAIVEPGSFPTGRVVAGWDLAGDAYNPDIDEAVPTPDDDPRDCGGHGTASASVAAGGGVLSDGTPFSGPYDQSFDPSGFSVAPGVAPRADIYAMKVFGCDGSTSLVGSALELVADPDEDGQFDDRLDVVNLSLGSSFGFHSRTDAEQMAALVGLGTAVVASAGNAGQNYFAAGTPAGFPGPISVGALGAVPLTLRIDAPANIAGDYLALEGSFAMPLGDVGSVSGSLVYAEPNDGCDPLTNAAEITGQIALIDRGTCAFVDKFAYALAAGATGVVIANYNEELIPMGGDSESPLPGVMIANSDATLIKGEIGSGVDATLLPSVFPGDEALQMAWFSSRGPSSVGNILGPDVSAPGDNIKTAHAGTGTEGRRVSGTSFSAPFVAGGVALLRQAQPALTPHGLKSLLMSSAVPVLEGGADAPVSWQGAGRIDLVAALERHVTASVEDGDGAVSVSFGAFVTDVPVSEDRTVRVHNAGPSPVTLQLSLATGHLPPGVGFTLDAQQITVTAGGSETFGLSLDVDPDSLGAPGPDPGTPLTLYEEPRHYVNEAWGRIELSAGAPHQDQSLSLPFHAVVRAAASRAADAEPGCASDASGPVVVPIAGTSAHPQPVVSAFELGAVHEEHPQSATDPKVAELDLRAVGVATNAATAESLADLELHFGIAIAGEWGSPAGTSFGVEIDTDGDEDPDYLTVALALTLEGPYADVFTATTYEYASCLNRLNLRTCEQAGDPLYANLVPASAQDTQPFLNSVLVLSTFAWNVGLSTQQSAFHYRVISFEPTEPWPTPFDTTEWLAYDFGAPAIDTAVFAPTPGEPLYAGDEPVTVAIAADTAEPPPVLLLHHTNVAGARWEVVELERYRETALEIDADLPDEIAQGATVSDAIALRNVGSHPLRGVVLEASLDGATVEAAAPSQGSCTLEPSLSCELGDIPAGDTVTVALELQVADDAESASVELSATSAAGCESTYSASMDLLGSPAPPVEGTSVLAAGGGCGCRWVGSDRRTVLWPLGLLLGLLGAVRRGRRTS